jgi:ABC-type phosphate transport system substrate-binding protein
VLLAVAPPMLAIKLDSRGTEDAVQRVSALAIREIDPRCGHFACSTPGPEKRRRSRRLVLVSNSSQSRSTKMAICRRQLSVAVSTWSEVRCRTWTRYSQHGGSHAMTSHSVRRLIPACILSAATVAALVAPGAASAGTLGAQCSGSNITGQGATVLKIAQQTVWDPDFNISGASHACNGTQGTKAKPEVKYNSTGSGLGLESWGANGSATTNFSASNAWVSTDEPPNSEQISQIEAHGATKTLETLPVLQGSIAIIVNLPAGCTGSSKTNAHRIVFNNVTLEKIFAGEITQWSQIEDNEDKLSGKTCNAATAITPVVRPDEAGTTHILKKYLGLINGGSFETEKGETKTWDEVSEGLENVTWPKAASVVRPAKTGDSAEIAKVAETPGSIGYGSLVNARSNKSFAPPGGGSGKARFWAELQNNGTATTGTITYAEPSTNGDVEATGKANCAGEEYANGESPFPPPSVLQPWNEVNTKVTEKNYTLCGLTYVLAFTEYSKYAETSLEEATTVNNFVNFMLGTNTTKGSEGGQVLINSAHDYLALPAGAVLTDAQKGAEKIKY